MRIALLGPLTVLLDDGTPVEVRGQRVRALAALLALQAGRTVTSARLIDGVWGEDPPAKAANALQTLVKRLRATCGAAMVLARTGGYCLAVAPGDVDAHRFTARVDQVRRMDAERCDERALASAVDQLAEALQMWSGPEALPGLRDFPGVASAATRLDEVRLGAVELLADHRLRLGRASESISLLTSEAEAQPLRESLTARLMTALAAAGRRSEALTVFHRARTMLAAELGVVPSGELRAAHRRILGRDASSAGGVGDAPTGLPTGLPTNLPRAHSSFVGREAEGARISTLLEAAALVTLTGPGGTGKTRLAVETATRIAGGYADGVWLVELGAVTDPARVGGAVLTALGIRDDRDGESTGEVAEALSGRQLLLVIDNCEHLLAAVAQVVHEIVVRCPRVKVLATSREPLDLPGEHLVPVPALSLPPVGADPRQALESAAVRLFLDRATQARPDFRLTEADCAAVCTICRELDGLPLALELAATRMRAMSPADLAAGLADRFELLAAGRRAADPRHRSLRAVVAWSWELLTEAERDLARRLAVFAGGATAETVGKIFGRSAVGALTALVDKSLVRWDGSRYRMLETIRAYAAEDAQASGIVDAAARQHAEFFTCLVEQGEPALRSAEQSQFVLRLEAEYDNVAAALEWALANGESRISLRLFGSFGWYLLLHGRRAELMTWRRRVLALAPDDPPPGQASAYLACAYAADLQDHLDPRRWIRMARDHPGFPLLYKLALSEDRKPHPQFALVAAVHAPDEGPLDLDRLTVSSDHWLAGNALLLRGGTRYNEGRYAEATADLEHAVAVLRRGGDHFTLIRALLTLATVVVRTDSTSAAAELLHGADELITRWVGPEEAVNAFAWIAHLHYWDADLDAAQACLERARCYQKPDMSDAASITLIVVEADVLRARGDLGGALVRYADVIRVLDEGLPPDDPVGLYPAATLLTPLPEAGATASAPPPAAANTVALWCRLTYAFALLENDDPVAACRQLAVLLALLGTVRHVPLFLGVTVAVAELAHTRGDPETAATLLGAATSLHQERPDGGPNTSRLIAATRGALGQEAFGRATARGAGLDEESLLELLLGLIACRQ